MVAHAVNISGTHQASESQNLERLMRRKTDYQKRGGHLEGFVILL